MPRHIAIARADATCDGSAGADTPTGSHDVAVLLLVPLQHFCRCLVPIPCRDIFDCLK